MVLHPDRTATAAPAAPPVTQTIPRNRHHFGHEVEAPAERPSYYSEQNYCFLASVAIILVLQNPYEFAFIKHRSFSENS